MERIINVSLGGVDDGDAWFQGTAWLDGQAVCDFEFTLDEDDVYNEDLVKSTTHRILASKGHRWGMIEIEMAD